MKLREKVFPGKTGKEILMRSRRYRVFTCFIIGIVLTGAILLRDGQCQDKDQDKALPEWNRDISFFPILCYDPLHGWGNEHVKRPHGLESIKACHFNVGGFVHTKDIAECEKLGLKAIVYGDTDAVTLEQCRIMWSDRTLTDADVEEKIRKMVKRTGSSKSVMGYFICDEPSAWMFPRLAKAVECVKKYAPGKLAYINLFPDYARLGDPNTSQLGTKTYIEYLERFVTEVKPQMLSYDNYIVQYSMDMSKKSRAKSYYRNLLAVRQVAIKHGLPFWQIISSNQIRSYTTIPSPANLYFQAYTTLAAGARGVTWYTYYSQGYNYAAIDKNGRKTLTWYFLKDLNRQLSILGPIMNRMKSTGVYFTSPPPVELESLPMLPGKLVKQVEAKTPIMVGEFKGDDGRDYVMIVNLSLRESVLFKIVTQDKKKKEINVISPTDGKLTPLDKERGYWLVAGQGVLLRL